MDLTFGEAMKQVEQFHPQWDIAVFEGPALKGVLRVSAPDVCVHGDQFELSQPMVRVFDTGAAMAAYECGCVYLGRFRSAARA